MLVALPPLARPAAAQDPAQRPTVKWDNGLDVETPDSAAVFQLGALIQVDGRFAPDDPQHDVTDTFLVRRARPILQGRVAKYFEFRFVPDFANGSVVLFDAYLDVRFSKTLRLRVGKDKTPAGLEQLYADDSLLIPERTLVSNLLPNRDVGIQAQGELGGVLTYVAAVFNGVPDGANGDVDPDSGKDVAGRVTLRPFNRSRVAAMRGMGVAVGATSGRQTGTLPSFKSTAQQSFFSYATGTTADGDRTRFSPSAFYYYKSLGAFAEYARTTQAVKGATATAALTHTAWEVTGSFVLTGELASEHGIAPRLPFDPAHGHWGAFELAVRYSHLGVDPLAFAGGFAAPHASRAASAIGVGAVLYASENVKCALSFERTVFDDSPQATHSPEHAVVFRLQLNLQPTLPKT